MDQRNWTKPEEIDLFVQHSDTKDIFVDFYHLLMSILRIDSLLGERMSTTLMVLNAQLDIQPIDVMD